MAAISMSALPARHADHPQRRRGEQWLGHLGNNLGATGTATVDGAGSTWTNSSDLYVGASGNGTLIIRNGGAVSNGIGYIGIDSGTTGAATVDGAGSTWTNSAVSMSAISAPAR